MTLQDFFQSTSHGAIAYSGGVDSSLLVWAAAQYGRDWRAYYVRTVFQPEFELLDAKKIAAECGIPLTILEGDILQFPEIDPHQPRRPLLSLQAPALLCHRAAGSRGRLLAAD